MASIKTGWCPECKRWRRLSHRGNTPETWHWYCSTCKTSQPNTSIRWPPTGTGTKARQAARWAAHGSKYKGA